ncbi:MAG: fumarylacetoacetate hydrolase family protein [Eikenella sp.]|nr:fumarylacetoacetate hydrolase family protein [Eikenella sp.]
MQHNGVQRTIYGLILNDRQSLADLGGQLTAAPYQAPPQAPVLYIKPANTVNTSGVVVLPAGAEALEVGATVALVLGKTARRLSREQALEALAGVALAVDLSVPHDSYYRPAVREKCFDGSLLLGEVQTLAAVGDLQDVCIHTAVNGQALSARSLADLSRDAAQLLADVTEFMTLHAGDVLLMGVPYQACQAAAADEVRITAKGLGALDFTLSPPAPPVCTHEHRLSMHAPRMGRVRINGQIHTVTPAADGQVATADGRLFAATAVEWLPPLAAGTVFALGLNYADHAKELAFKAPETPLVFLKGANTLTGHQALTRRPDGVEYMHYECELAVVIGKTARNVSRETAKDYILGYTVVNDYAIRDYLENYYRPNLRVKNRDHATPIGPWLTRADQIDDPMALALTTRVNGKTTQQGSTRDMIFSVYDLVAYLSSIMTLQPGDIILTGTPEGLADVRPGDVVETEIEGLGVLRNTIADDAHYFSQHA